MKYKGLFIFLTHEAEKVAIPKNSLHIRRFGWHLD